MKRRKDGRYGTGDVKGVELPPPARARKGDARPLPQGCEAGRRRCRNERTNKDGRDRTKEGGGPRPPSPQARSESERESGERRKNIGSGNGLASPLFRFRRFRFRSRYTGRRYPVDSLSLSPPCADRRAGRDDEGGVSRSDSRCHCRVSRPLPFPSVLIFLSAPTLASLRCRFLPAAAFPCPPGRPPPVSSPWQPEREKINFRQTSDRPTDPSVAVISRPRPSQEDT